VRAERLTAVLGSSAEIRRSHRAGLAARVPSRYKDPFETGAGMRAFLIALAIAAIGLGACSGSNQPSERPSHTTQFTTSDCVDGAELQHRREVAQGYVDAALKNLKGTDYAAMEDHLRIRAHFVRLMADTTSHSDYAVARSFFRAADDFDNAAVTVQSRTPRSIDQAAAYTRRGVDALSQGLHDLDPSVLCSDS
jgi:hypothetical protein